ncbi:hypothetical protein ACH4SP_00550 [Streptomyces sp. NPDC021093]|uniref:hypothetical protein n=1 Tax=Streptomyces sp. NPDC021093 TaxID=3365112 RepID=UPI00379329ED
MSSTSPHRRSWKGLRRKLAVLVSALVLSTGGVPATAGTAQAVPVITTVGPTSGPATGGNDDLVQAPLP